MNEYPNIFSQIWSFDAFIRAHGYIINEEWRHRKIDGEVYRTVIFEDNTHVLTAHQLDNLPFTELNANSGTLKVGRFIGGRYCLYKTWIDPSEWEEVDLGISSNFHSYTPDIKYKRVWESKEQNVLSNYHVTSIDEHYSFVYNYYNFGIGLLKDGKIVIPCEYDYITMPLDGWCFAVKRYPFVPGLDEWDKYFIILCDVEKHRYDWIEPKDILVAINTFHKKDLETFLAYGGLRLFKIGNERDNLKSYTIRRQCAPLFLPAFLELCGEPVVINDYRATTYWLSQDDAYRDTHEKGLYESQSSCYNSWDDYNLINDGLDGEAEAYWGLLD